MSRNGHCGFNKNWKSTKFESTDFRAAFPRFTDEARKADPAVDRLNQIARRKRTTPAQIALAWLLAQKPWFPELPYDDFRDSIGLFSVTAMLVGKDH